MTRTYSHVATATVGDVAINPLLAAALCNAQIQTAAVSVHAGALHARYLERGEPIQHSRHFVRSHLPIDLPIFVAPTLNDGGGHVKTEVAKKEPICRGIQLRQRTWPDSHTYHPIRCASPPPERVVRLTRRAGRGNALRTMSSGLNRVKWACRRRHRTPI